MSKAEESGAKQEGKSDAVKALLEDTELAKSLRAEWNLEDSTEMNSLVLESVQQERSDVGNRKRFFIVLCFVQILLNLDSGIIPACLKSVTDELNMDPEEAGTMGSILFIGLAFAGPISGIILTKYRAKPILVLALLGNLAATLWVSLATNKWDSYGSRFLSGFSQGPLTIYAPVWVDEFAPATSQTIWMSLLQGAIAIGVMLGYLFGGVMTSTVGPWSWRLCLWVQSGLTIPFILYYIVIQPNYLNITAGGKDGRIMNLVRQAMKRQRKSMRLGAATAGKGKGGTTPSNSDTAAATAQETISHPSIKEKRRPTRIDFGEITAAEPTTLTRVDSLQELTNLQKANKAANSMTTCKQLSTLARCFDWVCLTAALTCLYFVVTGIQFWITDFMVKEIGAEYDFVVAGFALTSITAPTFGVFFGGYVIDRQGGYQESPRSIVNALRTIAIFGFLALVFGIPCAFVRNKWAVIVSIWLILFFGGAVVPPATGMLIASVPKNMRAFAASTANMLNNIFGYALAPFIAGSIAKHTGLTWGFRAVIGVSVFAFMFLFLGWLKRWLQMRRREATAKALEEGTSPGGTGSGSTDGSSISIPDVALLDFDTLQDMSQDDVDYETYRGRTPTVSLGISGLVSALGLDRHGVPALQRVNSEDKFIDAELERAAQQYISGY